MITVQNFNYKKKIGVEEVLYGINEILDVSIIENLRVKSSDFH